MTLPPNNVHLFKLIWDPEEVKDGLVQPSAFRREDLSGEAHHVSVDRGDTSIRAVMQALADTQKATVIGRDDIKRDNALIGRVMCINVRDARILGTEGEPPAFSVEEKPIAGNDAHCGIGNITGTSSRGAINKMRLKLAQLIGAPISFDEAYGGPQ